MDALSSATKWALALLSMGCAAFTYGCATGNINVGWGVLLIAAAGIVAVAHWAAGRRHAR